MRTALVVLLTLVFAGPLAADGGPAPWEKDLYNVVRIDNLADWPEFVFFVYPLLSPDKPDSMVRFDASGEARFLVDLPTRLRFGGVYLYAVPKSAAPANLPDPRELRDVRLGYLKSERALDEHTTQRLPLTDANDTFVARYRVERASPNRLRLTLVESQLVPRGSLPGEAPAPSLQWLLYGLGLVVVLAVIGAVLWRARKSRGERRVPG